MLMRSVVLVVLLAILGGINASAVTDSRPDGITGATWQFGPLNRWAYTHIREILPTKNIANDNNLVQPIPGLLDAKDDLSINLGGKTVQLSDAMKSQYVDGILVIKNGIAVAELYDGTLTPERTHLMWSVSKTVTGLTAASVAADGLIDLTKTVADYVPELAKSGWGQDTLRDMLDMRDSSNWVEDYDSPESTVRRQDCADGLLTGSMCIDTDVIGNYKFLPTVGIDKSRQGKFVYKSGTTDVMAWVLEAATGQRFADLVSERVWKPIGAERSAGITVDVSGFTLASGGMFATLRDTARIGQLIINRGKVGNRQVIPELWIDDIFDQKGDATLPHLSTESIDPYYRSFVWGVGDGQGTVLARGVHGQFIYVSPSTGMVIAMYSSWPNADGGSPDVGFTAAMAILESIKNSI
jgi:CubicO group peptidase (beta-lactamase class C family)